MSTCNNFCPVWSECGYEHKGHCDCVQQRKFKPAPQAQEEPSGAPAPKILHIGNSMELRNLAKVAGTLAAPQPPAPASPAGRECWVEFRKGVSVAQRVVNTEAGVAINPANQGCEWVRMVEAPAAPEAGAPGTRKPTRVVRNHEGERCAVCDATYDHFHGYDAHGEVPGKFDGSDWDLTTLPRPGAPGTQTRDGGAHG